MRAQHRWKPLTNAMWRLAGADRSTTSGSSKLSSSRLAATSSTQVIAGVDLLTADLEVGSSIPATSDDGRLDPHQLLDHGQQRARLGNDPLALVGVPGDQSTMHDSVAETVSRRATARTSRNVMSWRPG